MIDTRKMVAGRGKILIICHDYASVLSPNAFRWQSVAEYWIKQGYKIYVVSVWKPGLQRNEILNGVHVHRAGGVFIEKIRTHTLKAHHAVATSNTNTKQKFFRLLKWFHDRTWKKIYWPDYACFWFLPAFQKANQIMKEFNIEYLISVSSPFTAHLVGNALKRKYSKIDWVVDILDPFCFIKSTGVNNHILYARLNRVMEKRIFRDVRAVSVLTSQIKRKYGELFPESAKKIFVNPNLLAPIKGRGVCVKKTPICTRKKTCLVFVGTLNRKVRDAGNLLQVFEVLSEAMAGKIELHFFGGINDCWDQVMHHKHLINTSIFLHGIVSRAEAVCAMRSADILVNIGNTNPYQEPSKLIEYVHAGRPIINIATISNDSSAILLEKYPAVFSILTPITTKNSHQINDLVKFINNPPVVHEDFTKEWLVPFTIEPISGLYEQMLFK